LLLVAFSPCFKADAAPLPVVERKTVGLALAGGGARGLAHIGVIRWLEEHRIPIDYITGTSMGGLVGGAFATGLSGDEIAQLVRELDWEKTLASSAPYRDLDFRRKEDAADLPTMIELGLRGGLRLPSALNPGHAMGLLFDQLALPYANIESFDELPTPFRCVAVDLISGDQVVWQDGPLSVALRSTMAIPAVFAPVRYRDMILVDGGILNNLPVDVTREIGSDVVVAVDLRRKPPPADDMMKITGALSRMLDVMMDANTEPNLKFADHILHPRLDEFETLDFSQVESIVQRGYDEAAGHADELLSLALDQQAWNQFLANRRMRQGKGTFAPGFVQVSGDFRTDEDSLNRKLQTHAGQPLDRKELEQDLTEVTGWGRYDAASYSKAFSGEEQGLDINVRRKAHGPPFLKPMIRINAGQVGDMTFEVAGRLTAYDVGSGHNEWRTDLSFGRNNLAATEWYQYIGDSRWFVAPRAFAQRQTQFLIRDVDREAEYEITRYGGGLDLGYNFGRRSEVRTGYESSWEDARVGIGEATLPSVEGVASRFRGLWRFDNLNSPLVPTRGFLVQADGARYFQSPGANGRFTQMEGKLLAAAPVTPRFSLMVRAAGGSTLGNEAGPIEQFTLGGPFSLSALALDERRGNHYVYGSVGVLRLLSEKSAGFITKTYVGLWWEGGDAFLHSPEVFSNGSAGIVSETAFGLLFLGGSVGESGRGKVYFSLGRFF
jgi:NTE family protein